MGLEWEVVVEDVKESFKISGFLFEVIVILVFFLIEGGFCSSLVYKYIIYEDLLFFIGSNNVFLEEIDIYEWVFKSWVFCSKVCGGGI